jgi:hypothetical protein
MKSFQRGPLSRHVLGQAGAVDLQRAGERVTPRSSSVEKSFGKAGKLASKQQLRGVMETLYDTLRKGGTSKHR